MAKKPGPRRRKVSKSPRRRPAADPRRRTHAAPDLPALLLLLVHDPASLEFIVPMMIDLGIDATVVETNSLGKLLREEIPLFGGIAALLPNIPPGRLLLCVTTKKAADRCMVFLNELDGTKPVAIVIPASRALGAKP